MKSPTPGWSLLCRNKRSPISSFCGSWDIMPRCCLWAPAQSAAATVCLLCYQEAENLVATVVPTNLAAAVPEVAVYLKESVGNSTRIDYGTGTCDPPAAPLGFTAVLSWTASSLLWVVWDEGALSRQPWGAVGAGKPAAPTWATRGSRCHTRGGLKHRADFCSL